MPGDAADPEHHPGMLDRVVGIQQLGADHADIRPRRPARNGRKPLRVGHLGVVVEEHQHIGRCRRRRRIVEPGVVEWARVGDDQDARVLPQPLQQLERRGLVRSVVDQDDADPPLRVGRAVPNAVQARRQQVGVVFRRDDDVDRRQCRWLAGDRRAPGWQAGVSDDVIEHARHPADTVRLEPIRHHRRPIADATVAGRVILDTRRQQHTRSRRDRPGGG